MRQETGANSNRLDEYIGNNIIKGVRQQFQDYKEEINSALRSQIGPKEEFQKKEKGFNKIVEGLDKLCKKGMKGGKHKDDIFVELVTFVT